MKGLLTCKHYLHGSFDILGPEGHHNPSRCREAPVAKSEKQKPRRGDTDSFPNVAGIVFYAVLVKQQNILVFKRFLLVMFNLVLNVSSNFVLLRNAY